MRFLPSGAVNIIKSQVLAHEQLNILKRDKT